MTFTAALSSVTAWTRASWSIRRWRSEFYSFPPSKGCSSTIIRGNSPFVKGNLRKPPAFWGGIPHTGIAFPCGTLPERSIVRNPHTLSNRHKTIPEAAYTLPTSCLLPRFLQPDTARAAYRPQIACPSHFLMPFGGVFAVPVRRNLVAACANMELENLTSLMRGAEN